MHVATAYGLRTAAPLLVCVALGCAWDREYMELDTAQRVNVTHRAIGACLNSEPGFLSRLPDEVLGPDDLNSLFVWVLVDKKMLSGEVLKRQGNLTWDKSGLPRLVDNWGNPLVFHVRAKYPAGLVCTTAEGPKTILALPDSVWPPEKGPVQVWSLGPNGLDDRGQGDDILP